MSDSGFKINRNPKARNRNTDRPIPGCLGRMVNLFDFDARVLGGNMMLTDTPHYQGSPVSRSQSDMSMARLPDDQMNNKMMMSELGKSPPNRKPNGTPIKMLIAHEMSKEEGPKQSPPNLVAKLMGLEDLPQRSASCRSNLRGSRSYSGSLDFMPTVHDEVGQYKDVFEIWQQSCKTGGDSPQKVRYKDTKNDKNMALVREKFMEAKRLSTDEKLRQSKQFQDALEVLSSNKDLFLKFLQEPNSLFSQHHNFRSVPPPPDSRRITVLRPSKLVDGHKLSGSGKKSGKQMNKTVQLGDCNMWDKFNANVSQPTRIVVLKPTSGKPHEMNAVTSPLSSLRASNDDGFYGDLEDSEAAESKEVPEEMPSSRHRRDETLLSSVFSNGYIGDESSFSKSEVYYAAGNLSDSEVMSPTSRHSWDYINGFDSPYSSSSFSRASYSPESSVCREAKKRLSERWAMMALNGTVQEPRHVRRSSSTLGEMLALSDLNKSVESEEQCKNTGEINKSQDADISPKNLSRSKSVPVSSTTSGSRLGEVTEILKVKKDDTKELTKEKSLKSSSFKGKVSSLFFSKSRKSSKQKSQKSEEEHESVRSIGNDESQCINDIAVKGVAGLHGPVDAGLVGEHLPEGGFSVSKIETLGNAIENQDQPSPISVLELQFEDDDRTSGYSRNAKLNEHDPMKYNLIDKSPPIGSIARTLSWDDSSLGAVTPLSAKTSTPEEEEQECFFHVQTLLSAAEIDSGVHLNSFSTRRHSPESPLDPSLRDKYMNLNDKEPLVLHSKQRPQRSFQKLVFDCVNEALISVPQKDIMLVDYVWAQMKEWISGEQRCVWDGDDEDGWTTTLVVEMVVRKEVVGEVWAEHLRLQIDNIRKEIEEMLLKELVEESVLEFNR